MKNRSVHIINIIPPQKKSLLLTCTAVLCVSVSLRAQDTDLLKRLNDSMMATAKTVYVSGTFKGTRIINTQSVEMPAKQELLFSIMHRFGKINDGAYQFFGLDNATMRMGFEYGITDYITAGIGRSTFQKTFDGFLKVRLLRQTASGGHIPFSLTALGGLNHNTIKYTNKPYMNARYRTDYVTQLLIARKLTRNLSLQLSPTWLHYNLVPEHRDHNDVFVLAAGGRMKITRRSSINVDFCYIPPNQTPSMKVYHSLSAGFDIETGGHVFQVHVTNSQGMTEPLFMGRTTGSWGKGDIYFGFNIYRSFKLGKK